MSKLGVLMLCCVSLIGCADSNETAVPNQKDGAQFVVQVGEITGLNSGDAGARWKNHRHSIWELKTKRAMLRLSGRFDHDDLDTEQVALDLIVNNVYLEFMHNRSGQMQRISCAPNREAPKGQITRTLHADDSSSGTFELTFESCRETYTEQPVDDLTLPIQVVGQFNRLSLK